MDTKTGMARAAVDKFKMAATKSLKNLIQTKEVSEL